MSESSRDLALRGGAVLLLRHAEALEDERDAYILKQTAWESANDELRSQHISDKRRIEALEQQRDRAVELLRMWHDEGKYHSDRDDCCATAQLLAEVDKGGA